MYRASGERNVDVTTGAPSAPQAEPLSPRGAGPTDVAGVGPGTCATGFAPGEAVDRRGGRFLVRVLDQREEPPKGPGQERP